MLMIRTQTRTMTMSLTIEQLTYSVPGMTCDHCVAAITAEVEQLAGVTSVDVDLPAKRVSVAGDELDDAAVRAAIDEAGYDVA
jgi:copper ion binding protein